MTRAALALGLSLLAAAAPPRAQAAEPEASVSQAAREALALVAGRDPYQRRVGFLRLEALREPAVVPRLLPYTTARAPATRAAALRAVAAIQGLPAVPSLLRALQTDRAASVRAAALQGLEPFEAHDPAILPALMAALTDRSPLVRMAAVDAVGRIRKPEAREAVLAQARIEHRRDVQRVLAVTLRRLGEAR